MGQFPYERLYKNTHKIIKKKQQPSTQNFIYLQQQHEVPRHDWLIVYILQAQSTMRGDLRA